MPSSISKADPRAWLRERAAAEGFDVVRFAAATAPAHASERLATFLPDGRQATSSWYKKQHVLFLVYQDLPYGRVDAATVAGTFGTPTTTFDVGTYHVAVWDHLITVSGQPSHRRVERPGPRIT